MPDRASPRLAGRARARRRRAARSPGEQRSGDRAVLVAVRRRRAGRRDRRPRARRRGGRRRRRRPRTCSRAHPTTEPDAAARGAATRRCARTRGAVMTLAWFDLERGALTLDRRRQRRGAAACARPPARARRREGALHQGRRASATTCPSIRVTGDRRSTHGDVIVLATDGIDSGFARGARGGRRGAGDRRPDPRRARQGTDDALVVVVRYQRRRMSRGAATRAARRRRRRRGGGARGARARASACGLVAVEAQHVATAVSEVAQQRASSTRGGGEVELAPAERGGRRGAEGDGARRRARASPTSRRRCATASPPAARSASGCPARGG